MFFNCSIVFKVAGPGLFLALNEHTSLCNATVCSHYSVMAAKLKKKASIYHLVEEAYIFSTQCAFSFVSHFTLSFTCSEVHRVRQVRVVLQMFALRGLGSRGLAMELTDVCP